jgi:hypothetical protein
MGDEYGGAVFGERSSEIQASAEEAIVSVQSHSLATQSPRLTPARTAVV